jgi:hypothetical protein
MGYRVLVSSGYNPINLPKEIIMKNFRISLAIAMLVLASLACQAVTGRGDDTPPPNNDTTQPTEAPDNNGNNGNSDSSVQTDFPLTADAYNVTQVGDGSIVYYTKLSAEDAMKFYRDQYTAKGYKEREILTVVSAGTFSMVFDGDPSGKAVVIQSVDLGDGSRTIAIRLEDV